MDRQRKEYLTELAEDYGVPIGKVVSLANLLGEAEDYDALVSFVQELSYMGDEEE